MAFSFGQSNQQSSTDQFNRSNQSVWGQQAPFLGGLFQGASNLAGAQQGVQGQAQGLVDQILPSTFGGLGGLSGIAGGGGPLQPFTQPDNGLVQQQLGSLGTNLADFFNTSLLPGLNSAAISAGGLGATRHNLAAGEAAGDMARAFSTGTTDIMSNAYNTAAGAAGNLQQGMIGAAQGIGDLGTSMYNLGMSPFQAAWAPLTAQAGILGGPTVLGQSEGGTTSRSSANSWELGLPNIFSGPK